MSATLKAIILAGGESKRMGSNKGRIAYHGKAQVVHCVELLESSGLDTLIASDSDEFLPVAPCLKDFAPHMGPTGGLLAAQENDPQSAWLVVACDMPFVDAQVISTLIKNRDPEKAATVFESNGQIEPLLGIWEPLALEALWEFGLSPIRTLEKLDCHIIENQKAWLLQSANTPEQRDQAFMTLGKMREPHGRQRMAH